MTTMTLDTALETITLKQAANMANSGDIDTAEFGHRLLRFVGLVTKGGEITARDITDITNLHEVLTAGLANEWMVAHLNEAIGA